MKQYTRFQKFMAAFCITLIVLFTGTAFFVADSNTRMTAFGGEPLPAVDLNEWDLNHTPKWLREAFNLLPAPARMLCWIPEVLGLALPHELEEQAHAADAPRFS